MLPGLNSRATFARPYEVSVLVFAAWGEGSWYRLTGRAAPDTGAGLTRCGPLWLERDAQDLEREQFAKTRLIFEIGWCGQDTSEPAQAFHSLHTGRTKPTPSLVGLASAFQ